MAKKTTQDDDSGYAAAGGQSGAGGSVSNPAASTNGRSSSKYLTVILVAAIVIVVAYYLLSALGGQSLNSKQIFSNVSSASLNQTQSRFVSDLERSENVTSLFVSYFSGNTTQRVPQSSNLTVAINTNETVDSYKLGDYNKTVDTSIVAYTNTENGDVIAKNVSGIYYYNTNTTLTCFNNTAYSSGLVTNSSLQCGSGDQGLNYIEETPYTAVNVSDLSYLVFNNTVTYGGTKTIAGRSCDDFIISNATSSNLESNYTVFNICVDTQYGVLLYLNDTDVTGGIPSSFEFTATAVSTNVPASAFVVPQQYLSAIQNPII